MQTPVSLVKSEPVGGGLVQHQALSRDKIDLLKRTVAKGATDDELELFVHVCSRFGLDPFAKQVYCIKRWDNDAGREVMTIQTGIDGFRLIADRTQRTDGQDGPFWCGADGKWVDAWLSDQPPTAAKVLVYKRGEQHPYVGVARLNAYCQKKRDGSMTRMWKTMAEVMLAKCAEALALRKAFPAELSGIYTHEEMAQADQHEEPKKPAKEPPSQLSAEQVFDLNKRAIEACTNYEQVSTLKIKLGRVLDEQQVAALRDLRAQVMGALAPQDPPPADNPHANSEPPPPPDPDHLRAQDLFTDLAGCGTKAHERAYAIWNSTTDNKRRAELLQAELDKLPPPKQPRDWSEQ